MKKYVILAILLVGGLVVFDALASLYYSSNNDNIDLLPTMTKEDTQ